MGTAEKREGRREGEDKEDLIMMDLFSLSYTLFPPLVIIAQLEGGRERRSGGSGRFPLAKMGAFKWEFQQFCPSKENWKLSYANVCTYPNAGSVLLTLHK